MVGVDRSTFYRHVGEKGITLEEKNTKRPKVDVSELIRVYGDKVKPPDQVQQKRGRQEFLSTTPPPITSVEEQIELHTLRERVKYLESLRESEKQSLGDQIELLKSLLETERADKNKATALLTDQRSEANKLEIFEKALKDLSDNQMRMMEGLSSKKGFLKKLFS